MSITEYIYVTGSRSALCLTAMAIWCCYDYMNLPDIYNTSSWHSFSDPIDLFTQKGDAFHNACNLNLIDKSGNTHVYELSTLSIDYYIIQSTLQVSWRIPHSFLPSLSNLNEMADMNLQCSWYVMSFVCQKPHFLSYPSILCDKKAARWSSITCPSLYIYVAASRTGLFISQP